MDELNFWFPFYIGDFLADTARLSTEEIGALLLLRLDYFRNGPPPNDERILRQTTRLDLNAWSSAWKMLKVFFESGSDGNFHNEKWDAEIVEIAEKRLLAKSKAKNAANARWEKSASRKASGSSQALHDSCQSQSHSHLEIENTRANTKTHALTAKAVPTASPAFITLPLNDKTEYSIDERQVTTLKELYPAVDVRQELRNYAGWANSHPEKRKTRRGILSSVNSWLAKEQDKFKPTGEISGTNQKHSVATAKQERSRAAIQKAAQKL